MIHSYDQLKKKLLLWIKTFLLKLFNKEFAFTSKHFHKITDIVDTVLQEASENKEDIEKNYAFSLLVLVIFPHFD